MPIEEDIKRQILERVSMKPREDRLKYCLVLEKQLQIYAKTDQLNLLKNKNKCYFNNKKSLLLNQLKKIIEGQFDFEESKLF